MMRRKRGRRIPASKRRLQRRCRPVHVWQRRRHPVHCLQVGSRITPRAACADERERTCWWLRELECDGSAEDLEREKEFNLGYGETSIPLLDRSFGWDENGRIILSRVGTWRARRRRYRHIARDHGSWAYCDTFSGDLACFGWLRGRGLSCARQTILLSFWWWGEDRP